MMDEPGSNPFIGLRPYSESETDTFFGRSQDVDLLLNTIDVSGVSLLYAKTGVGKSSLLRAGILPKLRTFSAVEPIYISSWQEGFLETICHAIQIKKPNTAVEFINSIKLKAKKNHTKSYIIILDQFEEFLINASADDVEKSALYLAAMVNSDCPTGILISMREEFLAELYPLFVRVRMLGSNQYRLTGFSIEQASAILSQIAATSDAQIAWSVALSKHISSAIAEFARRTSRQKYLHMGMAQVVSLQLFQDALERGKRSLAAPDLVRAGGADRILDDFTNQRLGSILTEPERLLFAAITRYLYTSSGVKIHVTLDDIAEFFRMDDLPPASQSILETAWGAITSRQPLSQGKPRNLLQDTITKIVNDDFFLSTIGSNESDKVVYAVQHDVAVVLLTRWRSNLFNEATSENWNSFATSIAQAGSLEYYYYSVNQELPGCVKDIVRNLRSKIYETVPRVRQIKTALKTPVTISQLLSDIMIYKHPILDIAYRDEARTGNTNFYKIGHINKCALIFHKADSDSIGREFDLQKVFVHDEPSWFSARTKAISFDKVFEIANSWKPTPLGLYCQTSTTIENELLRVTTEWSARGHNFRRVKLGLADTAFGSDRDLRAILNNVVYSHHSFKRGEHQMKYIALVDWPLFLNVREEPRYNDELAFVPVQYSKNLEAGFFLPPTDRAFSDIVRSCIDEALIVDNNWHSDFASYARRNLVHLDRL